MQVELARRLLGVTDDADVDDLRAAYRRQLLHHHPDRSSATDATERTIELTGAYRLLVALAEAPPPVADAGPQPGAAPRSPEPEPALELTVEQEDGNEGSACHRHHESRPR